MSYQRHTLDTPLPRYEVFRRSRRMLPPWGVRIIGSGHVVAVCWSEQEALGWIAMWEEGK